jgi:hypothetical protein
MAAFTALVLRTKERKGPDGKVSYYEAADLFGFDQWFSTDIHTARDEALMQKMAEYFDLELRDERNL